MSINTPYQGADELPEVVPVFPLSGALLLPRGELPLNIFEPRYMADGRRCHPDASADRHDPAGRSG